MSGLSLALSADLPTHLLVVLMVLVGAGFLLHFLEDDFEIGTPSLSLFRMFRVVKYRITMTPTIANAIQTEARDAIAGMITKVSVYPAVIKILAYRASQGLSLGVLNPDANRMDKTDERMKEMLIRPKSQIMKGMKKSVWPFWAAFKATIESYWPMKSTRAAKANAPMKLETRISCL